MGAINFDFDFGKEPEDIRNLRCRLKAAHALNNEGVRLELLRDLMGPVRTEIYVDRSVLHTDVDKTDVKRWLAEDIN